MSFFSSALLSLLRAHTPPPPPDDFMNDDMDSYLIAMDTSVVPGPSAPPTPSFAESKLSKPAAGSHKNRLHSEEEEEEDDETSDPERPPNKKVCFSMQILCQVEGFVSDYKTCLVLADKITKT